jgi:hypothetical protein
MWINDIDQYGNRCLYGCMGVWVYGCVDVWMYGCMEGWKDGCIQLNELENVTVTRKHRHYAYHPNIENKDANRTMRMNYLPNKSQFILHIK